MSNQPIAVRNPNSTRPYQHVLEPLFAYLMIAALQYEDSSYSGYYNVGPDEADCVTTGELADLFCQSWSGARWVNLAEKNAPHEANFLKLDCSLLKARFGWHTTWSVTDAIEKTVEWSQAWLAGDDVAAAHIVLNSLESVAFAKAV